MGTRFLKFVKNVSVLVVVFFLSTATVLILNSIAAYFLENPDTRPVEEMYTEFPDHIRDMLRYYRRIHNDLNYVELYLDFLGFDLLGPYPPQEYDPEHVEKFMRSMEKIRADAAAETPWYWKVWDLLEHPLLSRDRNTRNTPDRSAALASHAADCISVEFDSLAPAKPESAVMALNCPDLQQDANLAQERHPSRFSGDAILFCLSLLVVLTAFVTFSSVYLGAIGVCCILFSALLLLVFACGATFPTLWASNSVFVADLTLYSIYLPDSLAAFSFKFDKISLVFVFLVSVIGACATLYSMVYLAGDANLTDFLIKLVWFIISMLGLVLAQNFVLIYFFWECIGITSMWLINFNSQRTDTFKSALKAFAFNKLSDLALFSSLLAGYLHFGSSSISEWNVLTLLSTQNTPNQTMLPLIGLLLLLAACVKSAQFGFHLWLPDSMDAPVPASALIHSATLVSAGVYLLLRFNDILLVCNLLPLVILIGSITAGYGGVVAAAQTDLKRALAYSTISHCGFLFVCAGMGNVTITLLYLLLHGLFKALSFMCAGEAIRVGAGYQDINRSGGLLYMTPALAAQYLVALANLCGLPLFFGYSFKAGLQLLFTTSLPLGSLTAAFLLLGFLSSLFYFVRVAYLVFYSYKKNCFKNYRTIYANLELNYKYPIKTPTALFSIFWILYIASIVAINSMFELGGAYSDVNNYSALYFNLADMTKELGQTPATAPTAKISYLFLFYNAFVGAAFLLLQDHCSPSRGYFTLARITAGILTLVLLWALLY